MNQWRIQRWAARGPPHPTPPHPLRRPPISGRHLQLALTLFPSCPLVHGDFSLSKTKAVTPDSQHYTEATI